MRVKSWPGEWKTSLGKWNFEYKRLPSSGECQKNLASQPELGSRDGETGMHHPYIPDQHTSVVKKNDAKEKRNGLDSTEKIA